MPVCLLSQLLHGLLYNNMMTITSVEALLIHLNQVIPQQTHTWSHTFVDYIKSCHVPSERSVTRPLQSSASDSDGCPLQRGETVPFSIQIMNNYQLISLASWFPCGDPVTSIHVHAQKTCKLFLCWLKSPLRTWWRFTCRTAQAMESQTAKTTPSNTEPLSWSAGVNRNN